MMVNGGEPSRLPMMSPRFALLDVSPDGTNLLAAEISAYAEGPLWIVPVLGASPYRLGNLEGSSGAWSSDGQQIAYSKQGHAVHCQKRPHRASKVCALLGDAACLVAGWKADPIYSWRRSASLGSAVGGVVAGRGCPSVIPEVKADVRVLRPLDSGWAILRLLRTRS